MLRRVRIRIEVRLGSLEIGKETNVAPPLILDFTCPFIVIEGISTDPASCVDDGTARRGLSWRSCIEVRRSGAFEGLS